ncbi:MAG: T9SS type A sorting domain-containing protein [Bacteroidales bacterium]|nr:T9SS type A sorting domain-containing protein [Bacteroidales bacterium]
MKNTYLKNTILAAAFVCCSMASFAQCVIPVTDTQPFHEDFEDGMECWTVENGEGSSWMWLEGTESNAMAYSHDGSYTNSESRLISPTFDLSGVSGATLNFTYAIMGLTDADEFVISYRSSESDPWHDLGSFSFSDWQNFYEQVYELPSLSATYQISFLGIDHGGYYIFVDNVEITGEGGCVRPIDLDVSDITPFAALLHWSTTGSEESWTVELNGVEHNVATQPYLMENLASGRDYTFRVKANCGGGSESDWSMTYTFTTLCDVIVILDDQPYFDDFESSEVFVCWQDEIVAGPYGWVVDPGYVNPNNTAFFIWLGEAARLISAPLDLTAVTNPTLTFNRKQPALSGAVDELSVYYRTSEDEEWQFLDAYNTAASNWEPVTLSLPNPSATYQICFMGVSFNANGVYVDEVRVGNEQGVGFVETPAVKASVHPNPTTGKIKVNANALDGTVTVFDVFGKQVAVAQVYEGQAELDLSKCAQGVYFARITSASGSTTIKLVKE